MPNISDSNTNSRKKEKYLKGLGISSLNAFRLDIKLTKTDDSEMYKNHLFIVVGYLVSLG
jgi:hypothetical protein